MPLLLVLTFIVVPLIELAVIGQVNAWLGLPLTLGLLLVDSVIGAVLLRREGRRAWDAFRRALAESRWPGDEVAQGGLVLVGGALLLTPGFVTDAVGLAAVLPPSRALLSRLVRARLTPAPFRVFTGTGRGASSPRAGRAHGTTGRERGDGRRDVVDVEVVSVERDDGGESSEPLDGPTN